MDVNADIKKLLEDQNEILLNIFKRNLYSHSPFATLLTSEIQSYEDMDGNDLLFCIDFIFNVPFSHLSPMIQMSCEIYWPPDDGGTTAEYYTHYLENPGDLKLLSFEDYRDSILDINLRDRVDNYIKNYQRLLLNFNKGAV